MCGLHFHPIMQGHAQCAAVGLCNTYLCPQLPLPQPPARTSPKHIQVDAFFPSWPGSEKLPLHFKEQCFSWTTSHVFQPWGLVHELIMPVHGGSAAQDTAKQGQLLAGPVTAWNCRAVVWLLSPGQAGSPSWSSSLSAGRHTSWGERQHWEGPQEHLWRTATAQQLGTSRVTWPYMRWELESSGLSPQAEPSSPRWSTATKEGHDHTPEGWFSTWYRKILQTSTQAKP